MRNSPSISIRAMVWPIWPSATHSTLPVIRSMF